MIAWAFAGGANARFPLLEIVIKNQKFLETPEVGILNSD